MPPENTLSGLKYLLGFACLVDVTEIDDRGKRGREKIEVEKERKK